ncbi:MAG: N-acetylglucosamine-6-phosphate deacetylase [Terracidiphilus sp.]
MRTVMTAKRLWNGNSLIEDPEVTIEEGRIASIVSRPKSSLLKSSPSKSDGGASDGGAESAPGVLDYPGATLAPAFFDVHIHGAAGHDMMEATPEALSAIGSFLATRGTGSFLATTVTAGLDATLRAVAGLAKLIEKPELLKTPGKNGQPCARPLGIHLEGPFLSHEKCGVQPREHMLTPDVGVFDRLFEAAEGRVRLMTLAPELPGAVELTAHATSRGVRVSMGHSNANTAETRAAIAAGATSATHTFNAMRALDPREPGIMGVVLTTDTVFAELICDGIHTAKEMVRLWYRAKGPERAILVTDAMSATGMPDGEYPLGGFAVQVANGRATARGVLAGSVLTLDRALVNFVEFTGASLEDGLRLLTANPAAMTGMECGAGSLEVGQAANLVAVDASGRLVASIVDGRLAGGF